jgi:hypothetical protein
MAYLIKIKDHSSNSECVTNKKTCLKNWKNDFLTVYKVLTEDESSFIDLNVETQTMNILKREKIIKKGYIYNTSGTTDKIIYSLSLIKLETLEVLTKDASTNTDSKVTFGAQTESTQSTQTTQIPKSTEATQTNNEESTEIQENDIIDRFENKYKYDDRLYPHDYFYSEDSCDRFEYFTKIYNPSYQHTSESHTNYYGQEQNEYETRDYYGQQDNIYEKYYSQDQKYDWTYEENQQYQQEQQQEQQEDNYSHYYCPLPDHDEYEEVPLTDIRIDPCVPEKYSKQDLINELKTKLYQPNYGLNYSNGYKLL